MENYLRLLSGIIGSCLISCHLLAHLCPSSLPALSFPLWVEKQFHFNIQTRQLGARVMLYAVAYPLKTVFPTLFYEMLWSRSKNLAKGTQQGKSTHTDYWQKHVMGSWYTCVRNAADQWSLCIECEYYWWQWETLIARLSLPSLPSYSIISLLHFSLLCLFLSLPSSVPPLPPLPPSSPSPPPPSPPSPRVQVFLVVLSQSHSADIIHEKGRCIWKGQCAPGDCPRANDDGFYNIFNNSEAYKVTKNEDPDWYGLITELCPLYAGK